MISLFITTPSHINIRFIRIFPFAGLRARHARHASEEPLQGPLHQSQGPGSRVSAIFGQWPGDEIDEADAAALAELS